MDTMHTNKKQNNGEGTIKTIKKSAEQVGKQLISSVHMYDCLQATGSTEQ